VISTFEIGTLLPQIECANVRLILEMTKKDWKYFENNITSLKNRNSKTNFCYIFIKKSPFRRLGII